MPDSSPLPREPDERLRRNPSYRVFLDELDRRGCAYQIDGRRITFRSANGTLQWFEGSNTSLNSPQARRTCTDKMATKAALRAAGVGTPAGDVFALNDSVRALRFARSLGFPVVVKPVSGMAGKNVYPGIASEEAFLAAWAAQSEEDDILVEKHVGGEDYRAHVIDGEIVAIARREPPAVRGDGTAPLRELIADLNLRRRRSKNPVHKQIRLKALVSAMLGS